MKAGAGWACAIVIVVSAVPFGGPAFAGNTPKLDASVVVRAPANANAPSRSFFDTVSCPTARFCAAGGDYLDRANHTDPMVAQSVNGKWSRAAELRLPSESVFARVNSIACTGPGDCVAVGGYLHRNDRNQPAFIAVETRGRWHRAIAPSTPSVSLTGNPLGALAAVSCPAPGSCVAVGAYDNRSGHSLPMEVSESHGRWGRARTLPLPANRGQSFDVAVLTLSCAAPGTCAAGGQYDTRSGNVAPMVISQSAGRWHAAATGLPADATTFLDAGITSVSCPSIGQCLAVGTYSSRRDKISSFAVTETGGRWRRPVRTTIAPTNAARLSDLELDSVTCTRPGVCLVVGNYTSRRLGLLLMAAVDTGGKWTRAKEIALPGDARSNPRNGIFAGGGAVYDTLAQFYRRAYLRWIDATVRRPELRPVRIAEVVELLAAGVKERPR
jgi:hypothetical protein